MSKTITFLYSIIFSTMIVLRGSEVTSESTIIYIDNGEIVMRNGTITSITGDVRGSLGIVPKYATDYFIGMR